MSDLAPGFDEWAVVELLGRRRLVGRVREAVFPSGFLRIDEPDGRTQFVNPDALYAMHPVTENVARTLAEEWCTEPINRWDLPDAWRVTPSAIPGHALDSDDDEDDDSEGAF
jgi:hypothetical protein